MYIAFRVTCEASVNETASHSRYEGALRIPRGARAPATEAPEVVVFVLRTGTCELGQRVLEKDTGFCGAFSILMK